MNQLPSWALANRRLMQQLKNNLIETKVIPGEEVNPIQIGSEKLQKLIDDNGIRTLERLKEELENGYIFTSPKHKQMIKIYLEKQKEITTEG